MIKNLETRFKEAMKESSSPDSKLSNIKVILAHVKLMTETYNYCKVGNSFDSIVRKMSFENIVLLIDEALKIIEE